MKRNKTTMNAQDLRLWALLLSLAAYGPACKKKDTMAPIVLGDLDASGEDMVTGGVAPPWQKGVAARLENGNQLIWLSEADRPGFDLRILIPTHVADTPDLRAAQSIVVFSALEKQLRARTRHTELRFERRDRPGRIEFAIHGRREDFASASLLLAQSFGAKSNKDLLGAAQGRWVATDAPDPIQETTLRHTERALHLPPQTLGSLPQDFAVLDDDALAKAWDTQIGRASCRERV